MKNGVSPARLFVILGMHRSGTSAVTRALLAMNVSLGTNLMFHLPEINARGFWEDLDINKMNEEMLAALGISWHHLSVIQNEHTEILRDLGFVERAKDLLRLKICEAKNGVFGFKDPRTAKLLSFWKEVFANEFYDVAYILPLRNPLSVVKSLEKRDSFESTKSYLLWLSYVITSLIESQGTQRLLLDFDELLDSPASVLNISKKFNLTINENALQEYLSDFLDKDLRHTQYSIADLSNDPNCPELVKQTQELLGEILTGARQLDAPETDLAIGHLGAELKKMSPIFDRLDKQYQ